jgi:hypothetical protein
MTATLEALDELLDAALDQDVDPLEWWDHHLPAVELANMATQGLLAARPAHRSPVPEGTDVAEAHQGAAMLGLPLTPQGVQVALLLNARDPFGRPLYDDCTIQIPRRATKTTSIQCTLLGRCENRPGYRVIQTAQDGTRASAVFMDMVRTLEMQEPDESKRNWVVFKSTGREYLQWKNGSRWWVGPPKASTYRGLAADILWFDESGELDPAESDELMAGALPVMDTRPDGQVIKSGTPGLVRAGNFWASLDAARARPDELGILDYSAEDYEVVTALQAADPRLWYRVHPGLASGLTSLKTIRKRFATMGLAEFIREYLCVWPPDTTRTALDLEKWAAQGVQPVAEPPAGAWALGYDIAIGGAAGAIAAAWFDENLEPHVQLMAHRPRSAWVVDELALAQKKHPRVRIGYDSIGDNIATAQALGRKPRFNSKRLVSLQLRQVAAATAVLATNTDAGTMHHAISRAIDNAAASATWRQSGGSRLFGRQHGKDISALLACAHALAAAAELRRGSDEGDSMVLDTITS